MAGRLRTGCTEERWFSSHLVPQDAEHAEGVYLTLDIGSAAKL